MRPTAQSDSYRTWDALTVSLASSDDGHFCIASAIYSKTCLAYSHAFFLSKVSHTLTLVQAGQVSLPSKVAHAFIYGMVRNLEILVCATISGSGSLRIRMVIAFLSMRLTTCFSRPVCSAISPKETWPPGGIISAILNRQIMSMIARLEI